MAQNNQSQIIKIDGKDKWHIQVHVTMIYWQI